MKTKTLLFVLSVAACGGAQTTPPNEPTPPPAPTPSASSTTAPTPTASTTSPAGSGTTTAPPPPANAKTPPIKPTEMADKLKELGIDVKALPPLNKIPADTIRKVMGTFSKSLGVQCTHCHDADDFKKPTPNKKLTARMWSEFTRGYTLDGGGALYCDSCHQGKAQFLVRDPGLKQISAWMEENFEDKLRNAKGQNPSCETCHGDPMEPKFLHKWKK